MVRARHWRARVPRAFARRRGRFRRIRRPGAEFDKERPRSLDYPCDGCPLIVGATQRLAFASCSDQPCFEPTPKVQPIPPASCDTC